MNGVTRRQFLVASVIAPLFLLLSSSVTPRIGIASAANDGLGTPDTERKKVVAGIVSGREARQDTEKLIKELMAAAEKEGITYTEEQKQEILEKTWQSSATFLQAGGLLVVDP